MSEKRYLDAKQEAARLGCSVRTLERRVANDGYPYIKFGGRRLFDPDLSEEYLAGRTFKGRAAELASRESNLKVA